MEPSEKCRLLLHCLRYYYLLFSVTLSLYYVYMGMLNYFLFINSGNSFTVVNLERMVIK